MAQVSLPRLIEIARDENGLVSFPTDTVPALAVKPDHSVAIFEAKQRSPAKPLILMAADLATLLPYVQGTPADQESWQAIADRYWPGALTLVLPASDRVPLDVHRLNPVTVGIRVPNHPLAQTVLRGTGVLATTSINRSGQDPLRTLEAIAAAFPQVATLTPEAIKPHVAQLGTAAEQGSGKPSTVAKWTPDGWLILRQGDVKVEGPS